jgi:CBS domain-containing protein
MRVDEIMTRNVVMIPADATLVEAAELMRKHQVGFLPVVTAGALVGVVTDRDIVVRGLGTGMNAYLAQVRSVMSDKPVWCYEHDVLTEAADILANNRLHRLIVVDSNNNVVGLLSLDDLAAYMSSDRLLGIVLRNVTAA